MLPIFVPIDRPSVLLALQGSGEVIYLTNAEILECLQIAELETDFPDLPEEWKAAAIPEHRRIAEKEQACG